MKYTLKKTVQSNQKYLYEVFDQDGDLISSRKSYNEYVACTADGKFYFGRLDLIGKGAHGQNIKYRNKYQQPDMPIAYLETNPSPTN